MRRLMSVIFVFQLSGSLVLLACKAELNAQSGVKVPVEQLYRYALEAFNKQDYATARLYWEAMAEQGFPDAQNNMGELYRHGLGVGPALAKVNFLAK